jgi:hypothetical protein
MPVSPANSPRVFGIGAAKTGTHTLAEMFAPIVRAAHERDAQALIRMVLFRERFGSAPFLRPYLLFRDRRRKLRVDVSQVNIYLIKELLSLFPDSRWVMTVRPPLAWLRSILDDSLRRDVSPTWMAFRRYRFGRAPASREDEALLAKDLFPLAGYLDYWAEAVRLPRSRIPADQLFTVETTRLSAEAARIAAFCGIEGTPATSIRAFSNPRRFGVIDEIGRPHVVALAEARVGDLARELFPGWSAEEEAELLG